MKKLKIGSKVQCRFFNTPDNKFYGEYFTGVVIGIIDKYKFSNWEYLEKAYIVQRDDTYNNSSIALKRKEIKKIIE